MKTVPITTCLLVIILIIGCRGPLSLKQLDKADYGTYPTNYKEIIKEYNSRILVDPYSARYRWLSEPYKGHTYATLITPLTFGYLIEVGVNSRNRMGGYVGEKGYWFLIKNGRVIFSRRRFSN